MCMGNENSATMTVDGEPIGTVKSFSHSMDKQHEVVAKMDTQIGEYYLSGGEDDE